MTPLEKGAYDLLIDDVVREAIRNLPPHLRSREEPLSGEDLAEYLAAHFRDQLRAHLAGHSGDQALEIVNRMMQQLQASSVEARLLAAVAGVNESPPAPKQPLSLSALITNDSDWNFNAAIRDELATADSVDWICPFIGVQGLNLIFERLRPLGSNLRVLTTTYLGATQPHALRRLTEFGAQVKVAYEDQNRKTALHAKAWIFHRKSGFTTATIGSSNLSPRALVDGLEWNLKLGNRDARQLLEALTAVFSRLWADTTFEAYDPARDQERLVLSLKQQSGELNVASQFFADLAPFPHQQEALTALALSRQERHRNLVVAATGTGKTLISAFDYKRFATERGGLPTLLFVAHRADILEQSVGAFRAVMRDGSFGELMVAGARPASWKHVFASVQSLANQDLATIQPEHFDYVVIDEFHHAEAPTYARLFDHFRPVELLGLTATPERADQRRSVIAELWPPTFELRIWHALDRQLVAPFHYFGIDDGTDLSRLSFTAGKYAEADLDAEYVERGAGRNALLMRELSEKVDLASMRGVAFCVSINHAVATATFLAESGIRAEAVHSRLSAEDRSLAVSKFRRGELQMLCTVDLFNEGVDIPEINTVVFLRPTESATVFLQQLGRGLRLHESKGALTVLDFVGRQNAKFRMDLRFRALTGLTRTELAVATKEGFPRLPAGCDIRLDKITADRLIETIKNSIPTRTDELVREYRQLAPTGILPLKDFLAALGMELTDLYRPNRSYHDILVRAGAVANQPPDGHHAISRILHVNDRRRLYEYRRVIREDAPTTYGHMLQSVLFGRHSDDPIHPDTKRELLEIFDVVEAESGPRAALADDLPFVLQGLYTRNEIVAPFRENPTTMREGTFYVAALELDVHLITLHKSERHFSPTTRYHDWFESPDLLHWESQSTTSASSATGRRLIEGLGRHLFFVRISKDQPYQCLGFAQPIAHRDERPIKLTWRLEHVVPDHDYVRFRAAAG